VITAPAARVYRALDPEGHVWNFNQEIAAYDAAGVEEKMGLKVATSLEEAGLG